MEVISEYVVGTLVLVLGLVGLVLASGALDGEMYLFGLSLAGFALVFEIRLIKRHFDRIDAARHAGGHHE
jgi:hypothetical protein